MFQWEVTPLGNRPRMCRYCCRILRWRAHAIQRRCQTARTPPSKRWRSNARNIASDSTKIVAFRPPVPLSQNFVLSRGIFVARLGLHELGLSSPSHFFGFFFV